MNRLNIGSGRDVRQGWDNLDMHNTYGANIIWNLNKLPLPIPDGKYEYIYCSQVLEHVHDPCLLLYELIRICKVGGNIEITVPNETFAWDNMWHVHAFNMHSFRSMVNRSEEGYPQQIVIDKLKYYGYIKDSPPLSKIYSVCCSTAANILGSTLMCSTFLKHLFPLIYIRCIYRKIR